MGAALGSLRDALSDFVGSISDTMFGDVFEAEETEERDIEMGLLGNSRETRANLPIDIDEMVLSNKCGLVEDFSGSIEVFEIET
uniref:Uncharacterized protein n=1 Tax=Tanacetum cinerariifolium TaxID=118510 RepID=A0A699L125_TANCI|nr:hypothetical protein [Tanacetum cinerariifolium]